jgi:hypothetical protein
MMMLKSYWHWSSGSALRSITIAQPVSLLSSYAVAKAGFCFFASDLPFTIWS